MDETTKKVHRWLAQREVDTAPFLAAATVIMSVIGIIIGMIPGDSSAELITILLFNACGWASWLWNWKQTKD